MAANAVVNLLQTLASAGTAVANSTTETALLTSLQLPAHYLEDMVGKTLRITAAGQYTTTGTPTLILATRIGTAGSGGTVANDALVAGTGTYTTSSGVTAQDWFLDVIIQTRAIGASGTVMGNGVAYIGKTSTSADLLTLAQGSGQTPATATVDTTQAEYVSITAKWGTANASNTITLHNLTIESLN